MEAALRVYEVLDEIKASPGLYYTDTSVETGKFTSKSVTFGAVRDSFFEYLIKLYVILGPKDTSRDKHLRMFEESMGSFKKDITKKCGRYHCLGYTNSAGNFISHMQHLHFFVSGMLLLGNDHLP